MKNPHSRPSLPTAPGPALETKPSAGAGRLRCIDQMRGLVMVLMVLDHALFYFTDPSVVATNLSFPLQTTAGLFWTEWITDFCAPVFFLLAGTGAFLQLARGATKGQVARYLLIRGALLVLLDFTLMQWLLYFRFDFSVWHDFTNLGPERVFYFTPLVLYGLGLSMIVLAGLIWFPLYAIAGFSLALILFHNLIGPRGDDSSIPFLWGLLHQRGNIILSEHLRILTQFPLIPWCGVMALGYVLGALFMRPRVWRRKVLFATGAALTLLFPVMRWASPYGDPYRWTPITLSEEQQGESNITSATYNVLSFVDCDKYPASLEYLLMTLGPSLIVLGLLDRADGAAGAQSGSRGWIETLLQPLTLFGRVPLFFYFGQWFFLHLLAVIFALLEQRPVGWLFETIDLLGGGDSFPGWDSRADAGLGGTFLAALVTVLLLYPCCWGFAKLKRRYPRSALRYF
ncbi:MAG TPA: heparan-alpha-glucosaminide N-acetyltransferase domain-containing protein [Pirellulales bacterium]|jgi:uncharacterized membrane protein|nr:heparan-alpha-glucosaminide N-acetyltransferase domain-containing protein [Pirellulales bacterium]